MADVKEPPLPEETDLVGEWLVRDDKVIANRVCERIEWLIRAHLEQVATSNDGAWETLYRDPRDGRYWERTYPHSDWHGGGPPRLTAISFVAAKEKYGIGN